MLGSQVHAIWGVRESAQVAQNTGCDNPALIDKALAKAGGNVDAAIERVIEWMAGEGEEDQGGEETAWVGVADSPHQQPAAGAQRGESSGTHASGESASEAQGSSSSHDAASASNQAGIVQIGCSGAGSSIAVQEEASASSAAEGTKAAKLSRKPQQADKRPGRNKLCLCSSGKKYKNCCGVAAAATERRRKALQETGGDGHQQLSAHVASLCI